MKIWILIAYDSEMRLHSEPRKARFKLRILLPRRIIGCHFDASSKRHGLNSTPAAAPGVVLGASWRRTKIVNAKIECHGAFLHSPILAVRPTSLGKQADRHDSSVE